MHCLHQNAESHVQTAYACQEAHDTVRVEQTHVAAIKSQLDKFKTDVEFSLQAGGTPLCRDI